MAMELSKIGQIGSCVCMSFVQLVVLIWAMVHLPALRDHWLASVPEEATVLTVQMEGFWGPAHAIIPTNCSRFNDNRKLFANKTERRLEAGRVGEFSGVSYRGNEIIVHRCGESLKLKQPTSGQYYLAMLALSGKDDMQEIRHTRGRKMWLFIIVTLFEFVLQVGVKGWQLVLHVYPSALPADQVALMQPTIEQEKSLPVKVWMAFAKVPKEIIEKVATTQAQFAMLSLFLIYWHDDYYITSFIPGKAYIMLFMTYFFLIVLYVLYNAECKTAAAVLACILVVYMVFVSVMIAIPLICGYAWYNANFMWNTGLAEDFNKITHHTTKFQGDADYLNGERVVDAQWADLGAETFKWLGGAHVLEIILNFGMGILLPCVECAVGS